MREPDFVGVFGRAWKLSDEAIRRASNLPDDVDVPIKGVWVVCAPNSHPVWPWYRVLMYDLKRIAGVPDAKIYLPGATHEFVVQALNPNNYPPTVDEMPMYYLTPANFAAQMVCPSDEAAVRTIEALAIKDIVNGRLSPDTDFTFQWVARFGDNMIKG